MEKQKSDYETLLRNLTDRLNFSEQELSDLRDRYNTLETDHSVLKESLKTIETERDNTIKRYEEEIHTYQNSLSDLANAVAERDHLIKEHKAQNSELVKLHESLLETYKSETSKFTEYLEEQRHNYIVEIDSLKQKNSALLTELEKRQAMEILTNNHKNYLDDFLEHFKKDQAEKINHYKNILEWNASIYKITRELPDKIEHDFSDIKKVITDSLDYKKINKFIENYQDPSEKLEKILVFLSNTYKKENNGSN